MEKMINGIDSMSPEQAEAKNNKALEAVRVRTLEKKHATLSGYTDWLILL